MEDCLSDVNHRICEIYLDDVIVYIATYEEHLERIQQVFNALRTSGLKLSPKKCYSLKDKVKNVGHVISANGIEPYPYKISKIKE